jgi:hypothetical protein
VIPGGRRLDVERTSGKFRTEDLELPLELIEAHRYVDGGHEKSNVIVTVRPEEATIRPEKE